MSENDSPGIPPLSLRSSAFFYFGFFPLVILLWAWADSVKNHTNWFHRLKGDRTLAFILENSTLRAELIRHKPGYDGPPMPRVPLHGGSLRFGADTPDADGKPMPLFPAYLWRFSEEERHPSFQVRIFTLPLWLILVGYVPLWLGASYLLARRKRTKLLATLPRPAAEPPGDDG